MSCSFLSISVLFVFPDSFRRGSGRARRLEEVWDFIREALNRETHIGIFFFTLLDYYYYFLSILGF
jgi:hypothetical protein